MGFRGTNLWVLLDFSVHRYRLVGSVNDKHATSGIGREFFKKTNFPPPKNHLARDGQIEKGREDVDTHQGTDTLATFVRKSSRESWVISMSRFLARNKAQVSQICEGDKYPTIGTVLTSLSMSGGGTSVRRRTSSFSSQCCHDSSIPANSCG